MSFDLCFTLINEDGWGRVRVRSYPTLTGVVNPFVQIKLLDTFFSLFFSFFSLFFSSTDYSAREMMQLSFYGEEGCMWDHRWGVGVGHN